MFPIYKLCFQMPFYVSNIQSVFPISNPCFQMQMMFPNDNVSNVCFQYTLSRFYPAKIDIVKNFCSNTFVQIHCSNTFERKREKSYEVKFNLNNTSLCSDNGFVMIIKTARKNEFRKIFF